MDSDGNTVGGGAMNEREIGECIALIESMMRSGRRSTEYWGWNFLLWASPGGGGVVQPVACRRSGVAGWHDDLRRC